MNILGILAIIIWTVLVVCLTAFFTSKRIAATVSKMLKEKGFSQEEIKQFINHLIKQIDK